LELSRDTHGDIDRAVCADAGRKNGSQHSIFLYPYTGGLVMLKPVLDIVIAS
jgi:hypothetical protein